MKMFSKDFWKYSTERAIKTFSQAAIAFLGTGAVGLFSIDWVSLISVSGGAAFLSLMTSVVTKKSN
jgi:hypothetical protein